MPDTIPFPKRQQSRAAQRFREVAEQYWVRFGHPCEHLAYRAPDSATDTEYERVTAELLRCLEDGAPHPLAKARRDRLIEQLCSPVFFYNRNGEFSDTVSEAYCDLAREDTLAEHEAAVFAAIDELTNEERARIPARLREWWVVRSAREMTANPRVLENAEKTLSDRAARVDYGGGSGVMSDAELDEVIERMERAKAAKAGRPTSSPSGSSRELPEPIKSAASNLLASSDEDMDDLEQVLAEWQRRNGPLS